MDSEYCDGYKINSYPIISSIEVEELPRWKGRIISNWIDCTNFLSCALEILVNLPQKKWVYQVDYGGTGLSTTTYLWKAIWYKLIKKDLGWGRPFKTYIGKDGW